MRGDLEKCIKIIFGEEGGYVNNPHDKGGPTRYGVTLATLSAWRKTPCGADDVKKLTLNEARDILDYQYARKVSFDLLPAGLDLAVFDFAVNSGPGQASKTLQRVLGVDQDGVIGVKTVDAISMIRVAVLVDEYCDARLKFLHGLSDWKYFGKGWGNRVERIKKLGSAMAMVQAPISSKTTEREVPIDTPPIVTPKAPPSNTSTLSTTRGRLGWLTSAGAIFASLATWAGQTVDSLKDYSSVKYIGGACAALVVIGAVASLVVEFSHINHGAPQ